MFRVISLIWEIQAKAKVESTWMVGLKKRLKIILGILVLALIGVGVLYFGIVLDVGWMVITGVILIGLPILGSLTTMFMRDIEKWDVLNPGEYEYRRRR